METIMPITTASGGEANFPNTVYIKPTEAIEQALILNPAIATQGPLIQGDAPSLRIPVIVADPTASITAEAQQITESQAALSEVVVQTRKLALLTSVSNEALTGGNGSDLLGEGVAHAMTNGADQIFLSNPGDSGEPVGLALIPGQTTITGADVEKSGLSPILDAIAQVTDLGANVTSLLMRYSTWARLQGLVATDGRPVITPDVAQAANPMLFGKPVTLSPFVPAGMILVNDSTNLVASASEVGVATSADALFSKDMTMMRAVMRLGFGLVKPERNAVIQLKPKA